MFPIPDDARSLLRTTHSPLPRFTVPCKASMLEVRALAKITEVLRQSQDIRKGLPQAVAILSMVGQKYKLTHGMKEAADTLQLTLASSAVTLRQIYADAPGQGTLVWRMGKKGKEAAEEIETAFKELLGEVIAEADGKVLSMQKGREKRRTGQKSDHSRRRQNP
jgi:chromosome partitioning protein